MFLHSALDSMTEADIPLKQTFSREWQTLVKISLRGADVLPIFTQAEGTDNFCLHGTHIFFENIVLIQEKF